MVIHRLKRHNVGGGVMAYAMMRWHDAAMTGAAMPRCRDGAIPDAAMLGCRDVGGGVKAFDMIATQEYRMRAAMARRVQRKCVGFPTEMGI